MIIKLLFQAALYAAVALGAETGSKEVSWRRTETFPVCGGDGHSGVVVKADFNQDGLLDVVGANDFGRCLNIYYGDRATVLRTGAAISLVEYPYSISVANLNRDSFPDLVFHGMPGQTNTHPRDTFPVCAMLNLGGTFASPVCVQVPLGSRAVTVDDFDGDGISEFVYSIAKAGSAGFQRHVFDASTRAFRPTADVIQLPGVLGVMERFEGLDFNGDGRRDLAYQRRALRQTDPPPAVAVAINEGNGSFRTVSSQPTSSDCSVSALRVADINRDGIPDVAILCAPTLIVFAGTRALGAPSLAPFQRIELNYPVPGPFLIEDLDTDGLPDFVIPTATHEVLAVRNLGTSTFQPSIRFSAGPVYFAVAGDFDRDGAVDLLFGTNDDTSRHYTLLRGGRAALIVSATNENTSVMYDGTVNVLVSLRQLEASVTNFTEAALVLEDAQGRRITTAILKPDPPIQPIDFPATLGTVRLSLLLDAGTYDLFVRFAGNESFAAASSDRIKVVVLPATTTVTLSAPSTIREPSVLPITVSVRAGSIRPRSGVVDLQRPDGRTIATAVLSEGQATFSLNSSLLTVGTDSFQVRYAGERNFGPSQSAVTNIEVIGLAHVFNSAFPAVKSTVARDSLATLYLSRPFGGMGQAVEVPLPTVLADWTVIVYPANSPAVAAGLSFAGASQINLHVPPSLPAGTHRFSAVRFGTQRYEGEITIAAVAPGIFTLPTTAALGPPAGQVVRAQNDGSQEISNAFECLSAAACFVKTIAIPAEGGGEAVLILYGTGLRGSQRVSASISAPSPAKDVPLPVIYSGPHFTIIGLDQINLRLPPSLRGFGPGSVRLTVDSVVSNAAAMEIS